jgi:predicted RNA-binding Zn-ribbon protein involved in translation (DUF1610 family)
VRTTADLNRCPTCNAALHLGRGDITTEAGPTTCPACAATIVRLQHESKSSPLAAVYECAGLATIVVFWLFHGWLTLSSSRTESIDGVVTSSYLRDWVAIVPGSFAALCGLCALARRAREGRGARDWALAAILIGWGAYELARGFGVL